MVHPQKILLTGVSGFVGGSLGIHLRRLGYEVTGVSRTQPREGSTDLFLPYDLATPIPPGLFPPADAIVHCAALSSPWAAPQAYQAANTGATANLVVHAERTGIRHFVHISTSSVYYVAGQDQIDLTEQSPLPARMINLYAATKRQAEALVERMAIPWAVLRPRAVFGPGDTVLFPRILRAAKRGVLPRVVRPDGQSPWGDLIYIENLTHYIERALAARATGFYNLTNNQPVRLDPFVDGILAELGLAKPRRGVSLKTALRVARGFEWAAAHLLGNREPPITQFGVEVMAYSKTFDVSKMVEAFGPPPFSVDQGVERFLSWQRTQRL